MKPLVAATLEIAAKEVGVREAGDNRGKRVEEYLASIGLGGGYAWCAAYVNWCIRQAAAGLHVADLWPNYGYCPDIARWAKSEGILCEQPQPGDVFLVYGNSPQGFRARHTGFVAGVNGGSVTTLEGNTNDGGSAEGIGVFRRQRQVTSRLRFVRWGNLVPEGQLAGGGDYGLRVGGKPVTDEGKPVRLPAKNGRAWCPVVPWFKHLGLDAVWDGSEQVFRVGVQELSTDLALIGNRQHAPIRDLVEFSGLELAVDAQQRLITVSR